MSENTKLTESQIEYAFKRAVDAATSSAQHLETKVAAEAVAKAALAAANVLYGKKAS
ncbi:hypothetical protein [Paenalcaligenes suwonensis]|uniref:hypothetical protein n=1 Tax=Paenalcaligenes suwonensis TaxID=1202713 RepID=UPI00140E2AF0|nr:hypothetical protein [Paenalcaligenes suwonensis]NHC63069.1 hypothetical protein [Paenalcaligenes suwonensis]